MPIELIMTEDGSHSLLNTELNETYHSVHGALQESRHVFIRHGLDYFAERNSGESVSVLEAGFGTGLNAMLALEWAIRTARTIRYTTLESSPVDNTLLHQLNYPTLMDLKDAARYFGQLHHAAWNQPVQVHANFILEKRNVQLQDYLPAFGQTDVIFYDAFAPSRQPELWEFPLLEKICGGLRSSGVFVTYCAKGQLKRDLRSIGLAVETLPGPPGKKEMVRAIR